MFPSANFERCNFVDSSIVSSLFRTLLSGSSQSQSYRIESRKEGCNLVSRGWDRSTSCTVACLFTGDSTME